jgi:mannose-6-phosphate isomerase-like protein (cupin superfamily)
MNARVLQLDELPPQSCPCGSTRRAFADLPGAVASLHLVDIKADAERHHHRRTTELYLVLSGTGFIELDGERVPVKPLSAVYIPPGVKHRLVGELRIINVPVPAFDPADEFVD